MKDTIPTILIADDEIINREILKAGLHGKLEARIIEAENGKEAICALEDNTEIDLVILDIMMPMMDGFDVLRFRNSRNDLKNVQVLIISAIDDFDSIEEGLKLGAFDFINKPLLEPVIQKILPAKIKNILAHKRNLESLETINDHLEEEAEKRMQGMMHAERLVSMGVLTSSILHEINTPLTYIKGNIEMLKAYLPILFAYIDENDCVAPDVPIGVLPYRDMSAKFIDMINAAAIGANKVIEIIESFRSFVKKDSSTYHEIDPHELIEHALVITENLTKNSVVLQKKLDATRKIFVNKAKFEQIFTNLILNAVHATKERNGRGLIRIETKNQGTGIYISVTDNGTGIEKENLDKIFEPFYTTKEDKGTGLGLYIVKQIITEFKGKIEVASTPGKGTMFSMFIPAIPEKN